MEEEEAAEQEKKMLAFRGVLLKGRGSRSVGVSSAKERCSKSCGLCI